MATNAALFAAGFFVRHPNLRRFAPRRVIDAAPSGGGLLRVGSGHPEARQSGEDVALYPKFWLLAADVQDFVFAHELGHLLQSRAAPGTVFLDLASKFAIDPWDVSALPFGQFNMDEAFADSFASWHLDGDVVRRYPAWARLVDSVISSAPGRSGGAAATAATETWYHLTDRARFKLDPKYTPDDNAVALQDRSGRAGLYLAPDVHKWIAHGYLRPFLVELAVDPSVRKDKGVHGRYLGEMFVPASSFDKLEVRRVIPLDAFDRELWGGYGTIESDAGEAFDTGRPLAPLRGGPGMYPYRGYRYPGPDVREMDAATVARLKKAWRKALMARGDGPGHAAGSKYPSERSPAFIASLPAERRGLGERFLRVLSGRPHWARFHEYLAEAPVGEIQADVAEREAAHARRGEQAKADAREEAARRRKFRGAVEVEVDPKDRRKQRLTGQDVWLYHGTSSKLLPKIRKEGLCPDPPRRAAPDTSSGYVYLTVRAGNAMDRGGDAVFYARQAVGVFGGEPVVLRVRVPWDALERDEDDSDIGTYHYQYRFAGCIRPEQIAEVLKA